MSEEKQRTINYYANHNNKLDCDCYTTIRPDWPEYYQKGEIYAAILKKQFHHKARILNIKRFYLKDLNDYISHLDCGKTVQYLKVMLTNMYPKKDFTKEMLMLILFEKIKD